MWGDGLCAIRSGDAERGVEWVLRDRTGFVLTGARQHVPAGDNVLVEGYLALGDVDAALKYALEAETMAHETQQYFYFADTLRLKGLALAAASEAADAEATFVEALRFARECGGRSLELRIATTLADHLASRFAHDEARSLLRPVVAAVREGKQLRDYLAAQDVLHKLA